MPHSSGGGSHSGGSHSGGSSSSGSSHSGGGGGGIRTSTSPFQGSHAYVRYREDGSPQYIYSSSSELDKPSSKLRYLLILFYVPFFYFSIMALKGAVNIPERLPVTYDTSIRIEDGLGAVKDETELRRRMEAFLDETGIAPALVTAPNSAWESYYDSMEYYAYDMYVTRFPDESHWLVVYTTGDKNGFDDWHFEGMQGNDTDNVLTQTITSEFNDSMTKYLMQGDSVDRALSKAFADIEAEGLMKPSADPTGLAVSLVIFLFSAGHMFLMIRDPHKKYRDYTLIPDAAKDPEYCEYCGSGYWPGTTLKCPSCGAPVKPAQKPEKRTANKKGHEDV